MARIKPILVFLLQSIVVGLAAAFVVVLLRPQLLPVSGNQPISAQPASYADAVDISAPAVANVYTRKLQRGSSGTARAQVSTSIGSAVIIDPDGYLVTNYHVDGRRSTEIRLQLADGRIASPDRRRLLTPRPISPS